MKEEKDPALQVLDDALDRVRAAHKEITDAYEDYHRLIAAFYAGVSKGGTYNTYYTETANPIRSGK